jgi:putative endonuclease
MAHVYVLYSGNLQKYYIGSCLNLDERLQEHINKTYPNCFTAKDTSWRLVFEIPGLTYTQARNIEQHIKKMKSKAYISSLLKYPEMIQKLKERYV